MSEYSEFGSQLAEFLRGFLGPQERSTALPGPVGRPGTTRYAFGKRIDLDDLEHLYAPQEVRRFEAPAGGIDNLALASRDVFIRPGMGEFAVDFKGYFQVARAHPTTRDWATADVHVNMTDIRLSGHDDNLGPINVRLNPEITSSGQTFAPGTPNGAAKCRIATAVLFEAPDMGVTLFNKEPILLMNDAIESIPPVEDPNGAAHIYRLPLYDVSAPDDVPFAYLMRLNYTVGNYLPRDEAERIRQAG